VFEQIREYQNLADDLFDTEDDVQYMNTFVDYVTMKLQKHISEKIGQKKKPDNSSKTFPDLRRKKQISSIYESANENKEDAVTDLERDIKKFEYNLLAFRKILKEYKEWEHLN
jgi:hypothetical protein